MRRRKIIPSKASPKNGKRACICPDGRTYSRKCCDGSLRAQGIGSITGTVTPTFSNTKSISFDGVDDDIRFTEIDLGTTSTVSLWVKPNIYYTGILLGCETYQSDYLIFSTSYSFYVRIGAVFKNFPSTDNELTAGSWHHLVIVRDGDSISTYVDGNFIQTQTGYGTSETTRFDTIANRQTGSLPWEGKIDEVSAYDSVLSAEDITAIYNSGVPNDISSYNPVLWYRMGDDTEDVFPTIKDKGSGGNDGTMTNMSSDDIVSDVPE
jgi:hypothetical protein